MKRGKKLILMFLYSIILAFLSMSLQVSLIYQIILFISGIGFFIGFMTLNIFLVEVRYKKNSKKQKEKNIRSYYRYTQLMDPPELDT